MHVRLVGLFFLVGCVTSVLGEAALMMNRDGLITSIPGWPGMSYYSARWEPLCGTIVSTPPAVWMDLGVRCITAINSYRNDTQTPLAFYDEAGVKIVGTGVGLGQGMCMCFSMSTSTATAWDICWYFFGDGRYAGDNGDLWPNGSFRQGSSKSLPQCANVDVSSLAAQWTQTAIMPTYTGQTINLAPSVQTVTLTPTLVNMTISSSTVITADNGEVTTEGLTYTTTAAVINYEPDTQKGLSRSDKIALGIGLGLGLPTLLVAIGAWCYHG